MKFIGILLSICLISAHADTPPAEREVPELERFFAAENVTGTFVLLDLPARTFRFHNRARAWKRFIPASTFKIANSLIGLNTGAVKSVDEILPYGGKPQPFKEWEHDMGLREAIRVSAVPIYQELARRIGLEKMAAGVKALGYGNQEIGTQVDQFWLEGPLEISAVEQTLFLERLVKETLPVSPAALAAVKEITLREHEDTYDLHYKTGWGTSTKPQIGWIVGWVAAKGGDYPFALNIDMADLKDAPKRLLIAKACLKALGITPSRGDAAERK